ncbi:hypothetical protein G3N55_01500 [Dissulfurirhabdus thermomarina]|uniref:Penicillin-binding protein activator LpoB n=1 Tax=Dissulfurirhabdus thermomarina TaxID=1765737 RepID=A0A6N9TKA8_DISTH|nr:hypothetical protein [Dissulfurirhabdus thermomarina]NDY41529.1 hypothetical protein [Dissulfurirhabdus thermomarina]NMX22952.1 hypothetical protein [Dissulfurirhabdus thermomarina]
MTEERRPGRSTRAVRWLAAGLLAMSLAACGAVTGVRHFTREGTDLGYVQRVAVLPFETPEQGDFSGERARDFTITQGLAMGRFDVVDKGLVDSVLREEAVQPGTPLDLATLKRLGKRLNVQAFLMGTVDQEGEGKRGAFRFPEIALTLRLVDAGTGAVLWRASGHGSGYSLLGRLFGLAPRNSFQVGMDLVGDLLRTLPTRRGG